MNTFYDEIISIEYVGVEETIDINTSGNRLFYANGILTHNSAVEEIEFDHSHISGGISKINTADNVFGIFTSRSMRERGQYQLQLMKTRSSSGVGQKIELDFNIATLRITDSGENSDNDALPTIGQSSSVGSIMDRLKTSSVVTTDNETSPVKAGIQSSTLKALLNKL